jgi:hypothetical protein
VGVHGVSLASCPSKQWMLRRQRPSVGHTSAATRAEAHTIIHTHAQSHMRSGVTDWQRRVRARLLLGCEGEGVEGVEGG